MSIADYESFELDREKITAMLEGEQLRLERVCRKDLWDGRVHVRRNATLALLMAPKLDGLAGALLPAVSRDPDVVVRRTATTALARLPAEVSIPTLLQRAADYDLGVRSQAGNSLIEVAKRDGGDALAPLVRGLGNRSDAVRHAAQEAVVSLAKKHASLLVDTTQKHANPLVRAGCAQILGTLGKDGKKCALKLAQILAEEGVELVRAEVARALGRIGDASDEVVAALEQARNDPDSWVRREAFQARERVLGTWVEPIIVREPVALPEGFATVPFDAKAAKGAMEVPQLIAILSDGRPMVRRNAAFSLGVVGSRAGSASAPLALTLRDPVAEVRRAAADALGQVGKKNLDWCVEPLVEALEDRDHDVAMAATGALTALGQEVVPLVVEALRLQQSRTRAQRIIISFGKAAMGPLIEGLSHFEVPIRVASADGLGMLGESAGAEALEALSRATDGDDDPRVRMAAKRALRQLADEPKAPSVREPIALPAGFAADSMSDKEAKAAAKSLGAEQLNHLLFDGRDPVRVNAARTLGQLGKDATPEPLCLALKDPNLGVRQAAALALAKLKLAPGLTAPALVSALRGADETLEAAIIEALEALGKNAVDPMLSLLSRRPEHVLPTLTIAARRLPKLLTKPLAAKLAPSEVIVVRENAADIIGSLGGAAKPILKNYVAALLEETDVLFRCKVLRGLGRIGLRETFVLDALDQIASSDQRPGVSVALEEARIYLAAG